LIGHLLDQVGIHSDWPKIDENTVLIKAHEIEFDHARRGDFRMGRTSPSGVRFGKRS
jgi:hypothetical protein